MKYLLAALLAMALFGVNIALAQNAPTIITPDQVKWTAGTGAQAGTQVAIITGDPKKPGFFITRTKIPDGFKIQPHAHSAAEHLTVLSGTLMVGVGDKYDASKLQAMPAGSYRYMPKGVNHFGMAKGVTIIEISGVGPYETTQVKPK
jgi:quercetin dioxygenase-like cupin family protein